MSLEYFGASITVSEGLVTAVPLIVPPLNQDWPSQPAFTTPKMPLDTLSSMLGPPIVAFAPNEIQGPKALPPGASVGRLSKGERYRPWLLT